MNTNPRFLLRVVLAAACLLCGSLYAGTIVPDLADNTTFFSSSIAFSNATPSGLTLANGLTLAAQFTPDATDITNSTNGPVAVLEIGGTSNGSGFWIINSNLWYVTKSGSVVGAFPSSTTDLAGGDNAVGVQIATLTAGVPVSVYASLNTASATLLIGYNSTLSLYSLTGVASGWNWQGTTAASVNFALFDPFLNGVSLGRNGGLAQVTSGGNAFGDTLLFNLHGTATLGQMFNAFSTVVPIFPAVKWAVGSGNWDTNSLNWSTLAGVGPTNYLEHGFVLLDDTASGASPITLTLTGNRVPGAITNNASKTYILAGGSNITSSLIQQGSGTLILDNGSGNVLSPITITSGTLQLGNNDTGGSLGSSAAIADNGILIISRTDNLSMSNAISGSGALSKQSSGSLFLTGANTYTGNTVVGGGTLAMGNGSFPSGGAVTVADGAALSVTNAGTGVSLSSLTVGTATSSTLQFNFPSGIPGTTITAGTLTGNGSVGIKITGSGFTAGVYTLVSFTTGVGLGNFHLVSVPPGVMATLATSGSSVSLNIARVSKSLDWQGLASSTWNTNLLNWFDLNNGNNLTNYAEVGGFGDAVQFGDAGVPAVTLTNAVAPVAVTFNSGSVYTLTGPGKITGIGSVTFSGQTGVSMGTVNDYSGGTLVNIGNGAILAATNQAFGSGPVTMQLGAVANDGNVPRTLTNIFVQTVDTGVNFGFAGSFTGPLTLGGLDLGGGAARTVQCDCDVTITGALTNGGLSVKSGLGTLTLRGNSTQTALATQQSGNVVVDGAVFTSLNGYRLESLAGDALSLIITNGGVCNVAAGNTTGNLKVGLTGGTSGALHVLDIASGTVNLMPTGLTPAGNNGVGLGQSDAQAILYLRSGGLLVTRSLFGSGGTTGGGTADAHFSGGTIRAIANATDFMVGLTNAFMENGGLVVDTTNYLVTVSQALVASGTGGLTKMGSGTLTLAGTNTYTGTTAVNAGKLVLTPAHAATGAITVSAGAVLAFSQPVSASMANVGNVTLATGSALEIDLSVTNAAAAMITNLTVSGAAVLNVSGSFGAGQIPLFTYNSFSGAGNLTLGTVPLGTVATIFNNTSTKTVYLNVSAVTPTLWTGAVNGNWDLTTTNWSSTGGTPVAYAQAANVLFNDTAATNSVTLTINLSPSSMIVSNNLLSYDFPGSGTLSGSMSVTKYGTNRMSFDAANPYTGPTTVKGGTIVASGANVFGSGTIIITNGGAMDLNLANADNANAIALQPIIVSGSGVNGSGALVNSSGLSQNNAFRNVTMTGDTTIGVPTNSLGIRTTADTDPGLVGNGYKLTKVGNGQLNLNGGTTVLTNTLVTWFTNIGNIDIQQGTLSFQRHAALGNPTNTITVESGATLLLFSLVLTNYAVPTNTIVMTNATLQATATLDTNTIAGKITLNGPTNSIGALSSSVFILNGPITGPGGVTFTGTNVLGGVDSYTGPTVVGKGVTTFAPGSALSGTASISSTANGTLDVSAISPLTLGAGRSLGGLGTVNLNGGSLMVNGPLALGDGVIGTLKINGSLTLGGNLNVEVQKGLAQSNDVTSVTGSLNNTGTGTLVVTNLGASLTAGDKFTLFSQPVLNGNTIVVTGGGATWTNNLAVDGSISVVSAGPSTPEKITVVSSGGNLNLSWPTVGWRLQIQTNALSAGLGTNWVTVPNSTTVNALSVPVVAGNPTVFLRLVYP